MLMSHTGNNKYNITFYLYFRAKCSSFFRCQYCQTLFDIKQIKNILIHHKNSIKHSHQGILISSQFVVMDALYAMLINDNQTET